ncbi:FAD-binding domain-containing protein [Microcella sp.]|uniref:FAD-binding domain-containing protein n=1 Tax=Microcella sp. TaxID=1913979 RepID=UPI002564EA94|nr:FAD-binding domain-containing protein [Microcella sp.]MBX9471305.1 DNA photolyase [Microcella sp.]
MTFEPTREAGLARLAEFVPRAGRAYAAERNTDRGPGDRSNVSTLSPWVRHRLVTEREVVEAVLQRHSLDAAGKFVQEVYWRTYWKGWLELRPSVWARYSASVAPALDSLSAADRATYDDAIAGRTGIEGFDDWARELVELGYLHNHARMWFASIWIFTLRLPWQLGADFFLRHLLDGDPASNTLSWRWVAGLQTVGKTYLATTQNIEFATEGRFSPRGLAESAPAVDDDGPIPAPGPAPRPEPLPRGRVGLLLHEDDLHSESLELAGLEVVAVASPTAGEPRSPAADPANALVAGFTAAALADGRARAGAHFGADASALDRLTASAIRDWASSYDLTAIVTPYGPVGPVRDRLDQLERELSDDLTLTRILRPWDALAWPHATRGFFPFREKIPALLREQQIGP